MYMQSVHDNCWRSDKHAGNLVLIQVWVSLRFASCQATSVAGHALWSCRPPKVKV